MLNFSDLHAYSFLQVFWVMIPLTALGLVFVLENFRSRHKSRRFKVVCEVEVGTFPAISTLTAQLKLVGAKITAKAASLIPQVAISDQEVLKIVTPTVKELGFNEVASLKNIRARGIELGYKLCAPDVALSARIIYVQPVGEKVYMAMEPLQAPGDKAPFIFLLLTDANGRWLAVGQGDDSEEYVAERKFAFIDPTP